MQAVRQNIGIHSVVLALLVGAWALALWHAESSGVDGLANLGLVLLILPLLGYALVTSLLMLGLSRRRHAAALVHAVGLCVLGAALAIGRSVERRDAAATASAETDVDPAACLEVGPIRVQTGVRMIAEVTVTNVCATAISIGDVDLNGFPSSGGNTIFSDDRQEPIELPPGAWYRAQVTEIIEAEAGRALDGWSWRSNVELRGPDGRLTCFATVGAPATRGCTILDAAAITFE